MLELTIEIVFSIGGISKCRSVQIFDELPNLVYQKLVDDEPGFYLKPLDIESDDAARTSPDEGELTVDLDLNEPGFDNVPESNGDQLQTHLEVEKLEKALKCISREARSGTEESD